MLKCVGARERVYVCMYAYVRPCMSMLSRLSIFSVGHEERRKRGISHFEHKDVL
jgi:hypothetical protein